MKRHPCRTDRFSAGFLLCALLILLPAVSVSGIASPQEGVITRDAALREAPPAATLGAAADSVISSLVAAVNEDSLYAFLEGLTGEIPVDLGYATRSILTRYSGTEGVDKAADLLEIVLESHGYQVARHFYLFNLAIQNILAWPDGRALAVAGAGHVITTADGDVWSRSKVGIDTISVALRAIDHVNGDDYVFVGNAGVIATSDDGGATWTERAGFSTRRLNGVAVNETGRGWAVGKDGEILFTTDGGVSWSAQTSGVTSFLYDVAALDDATAIAVGAGGVVRRTTDGGASWVGVASGSGEDLFRVDFQGSRGWTVGVAGTILASTDAGETWVPQSSGTSEILADVSFADSEHGWVVGSASTILQTSDGGANWSTQSCPLAGATLTSVAAATLERGWVGGVGGLLLRTTNGGTTWTDASGTIQAGWANVEATLPGTRLPQEEVLLIGHYDSISGDPDLAPGADDNGSGIAAIVEAARTMSEARYERTIKFVCVSGEEQGLYGSAAYAARASALGTQIVGVFNLDSVGWNDAYFRIFSNANSAWLGDIAVAMASRYAPGLPTYHWDCPGCTWSDHASFWTYGYPAIVGIEPWDPVPTHHHTTGDTLGLLDMSLVAEVTKISLATIATVASVDTIGASAIPDLPDGAMDGVAFRLDVPQPNPSAGVTTLRFYLPDTRAATLRVVDAAGRHVRTLRQGTLPGGEHRVAWDGRNQAGKQVAAGVYFCTLSSGSREETRKLILMR